MAQWRLAYPGTAGAFLVFVPPPYDGIGIRSSGTEQCGKPSSQDETRVDT